MTSGEMENAVRRALNLLDEWLEVTGVVEIHSSYYHELQGVVEDAVHCGAQAATGDYRRLDGESGPVPSKASPYNTDAVKR
jgi:hypothetical protein